MVKQGKSVLQYILQNSSLLDEVCYIPSYKRYSTIDEDETIELASEAAAISKSDMIAFMQGFADAIEYFVCNGHSVKIDGVGTFSLSINANTYAVNAASIPSAVDSMTGVHINFLPDRAMKNIVDAMQIDTVALNPDNLTEDTELQVRGITIGNNKFDFIGKFATTEIAPVANNDKIIINGFNLNSISTKQYADGTYMENLFNSVVINYANGTSQTAQFTGCKGGILLSGKAALAAATQVSSIVLGGNTYTFQTGTVTPTGTFKLNDTTIVNGQAVVNDSGNFRITGSNLSSCVPTMDGTAVSLTSVSDSEISWANNLESGSHTLVFGSTTIQFTLSDVPVPSVTSVTSNGVTVPSGGSSTITPGQTYAMVANGTNLSGLIASNITVPTGCSVSGFTVESANRITFNLVCGDDAQAGTMNIGSYFSCSIALYSPTPSSATITTAGGVATGGTVAAENTTANVALVGTNLEDLSADQIGNDAGGSMTFVVSGQSATGATLQISGIPEGPVYKQKVIIYSDSTKTTSIFEFYVYSTSEGGGYG